MYYTIVDYTEKGHHLELPNYEDFGLDIHCGGKVQWCWSKRFHEWSLHLLYYNVKSVRQLKPQVLQLRPLSHHSGFVLPGRGLHWHRVPQLRRN